jgi:dihydrofolate reductase
MRKLIVNSFVTLDGVMQAPGTPEEDPTGGFAFGGWTVPYWDEAMGEWLGEGFGRPFEMLLGRKTYETFAAHWRYVTDDPVADALNAAPKHIASRTLDKVEWANSTLIAGDVGDHVRGLKAGDGPEVQVHGSGDLIQTLLAQDLVDEFNLLTFPVVLGTGKRLFGGGTAPGGFRVTRSAVASTGVVMATYARAGEVPTGSFGLEQPTEAELERRRHLD